MIVGAVRETISPGKGPVTMETENITMTMAVTKLEEILGLAFWSQLVFSQIGMQFVNDFYSHFSMVKQAKIRPLLEQL